jgi:PHD/YefM family antitoxin component YafN of YafNO toxin-antitoxin module
MAADERWTVARATRNFDELLEKVIMTRKPVFIDGQQRSAVLISIGEWNAIQDELRPGVPPDLGKIAC